MTKTARESNFNGTLRQRIFIFSASNEQNIYTIQPELLTHQKEEAMKTLIFCCSIFLSVCAMATQLSQKPVIGVIGASYENAESPFNDELSGPLAGFTIGQGEGYIDLSSMFERKRALILNEAQAGASTVTTVGCTLTECGSAFWDGFDVQLNRVIARGFNPFTLAQSVDYVVIGLSNRCLHSDSIGQPWTQTSGCSQEQLDSVVSQYVALAQTAIDQNITPVISQWPEYNRLDLLTTKALFGFTWVITEQDYNYLRDNLNSALSSMEAVLYINNTWKNFELWSTDQGDVIDGIHPSPKTIRRAASRILYRINEDYAQ